MEGVIVNCDYYIADLAENKRYKEGAEGLDMSGEASFHSVPFSRICKDSIDGYGYFGIPVCL